MTARYVCGICHVRHSPRCTATSGARWPVADLLDHLDGDALRLRRLLGPDRTRTGMPTHLTDRLSDEWAALCELHPLQVWGWPWIDAALTPLDAEKAATWRPTWLDTEPDCALAPTSPMAVFPQPSAPPAYPFSKGDWSR